MLLVRTMKDAWSQADGPAAKVAGFLFLAGWVFTTGLGVILLDPETDNSTRLWLLALAGAYQFGALGLTVRVQRRR